MRTMPMHAWVYPARLVRVVDGDSLWVLVDRGLRGYQEVELRLIGLDTPEMTGAERRAGLAARDFVTAWLVARAVFEEPLPVLRGKLPWPLLIRTEKDAEKYGRWLADVWVAATGENLQDAIEAAGFDKGTYGLRE